MLLRYNKVRIIALSRVLCTHFMVVFCAGGGGKIGLVLRLFWQKKSGSQASLKMKSVQHHDQIWFKKIKQSKK